MNDEVAVVVGVRAVVVLLEAVALGKAGEIEPVAGPVFAVVMAGEEFVDEGLGAGFGILDAGFHELFDFLGSRRKAGEIEVEAAGEDGGGGAGIGG